MSAAPIAEGTHAPELPAAIEAEQNLLGAILINNSAYEAAALAGLEPEHFAEAAHERIYRAAGDLIGAGKLANPVTLKSYFEADDRLVNVGGALYLARLAGAAVGVYAAPHYAALVVEAAKRRALILLAENVAERAREASLADPADIQIDDASQALYSLAEGDRAAKQAEPIAESLTKALVRAEKAYQSEGGLTGIPTGLIDVDKALGGMQATDVIVIASRPAMGKTALACTIALNAALGGRPVIFFSLEMSAEQIGARFLAMESGVPASRQRRGPLDAEEMEKLVQARLALEELPLWIDERAALSLPRLRISCENFRRRVGDSAEGLVVVDYIQLMSDGMTRRESNRVQEISVVTQGLKAIAKSLSLPVLALSQLSRAVELRQDKRPVLSDLRESGSIEQDADQVAFLYRADYYLERAKPGDHEAPEYYEWVNKLAKARGKAEIIIGKDRHGPGGLIEVQFDAASGRFRNLSQASLPGTEEVQPL